MELLTQQHKDPPIRGIYCIKDKQTGDIVYIGESKHMWRRCLGTGHSKSRPHYKKEEYADCEFFIMERHVGLRPTRIKREKDLHHTHNLRWSPPRMPDLTDEEFAIWSAKAGGNGLGSATKKDHKERCNEWQLNTTKEEHRKRSGNGTAGRTKEEHARLSRGGLTKEEHAKRLINKDGQNAPKPVAQLDGKDGNITQYFDSGADAARWLADDNALNATKHFNVGAACHKGIRTGGYYWRFLT